MLQLTEQIWNMIGSHDDDATRYQADKCYYLNSSTCSV